MFANRPARRVLRRAVRREGPAFRVAIPAIPIHVGEEDGGGADAVATERMIDEGGPVELPAPSRAPTCAHCGGPRSVRATRCARCARRARGTGEVPEVPDLPAEQRLTERRGALNRFRLYCFSCGRSTTVASPPAHPGRCLTCGGTMLSELDTS
jgi:ribosomal protein S27E